ncbi:hypothetical protein RI570_13405 [Brucella pseudogrignonensis]|uniref:hypothetical protein n=1 Tax=Brucella pseudogrignonensis TaxID=419475 RepID=UPI0028BA4B52|nr:hypothetical protein [Brucella pseudogrignonensis]MDT6941131.1 hypothetical protein [Brucella pseudogrignonensis]
MRKSTFAGIIGLSLLATSALAQTESEFFHNGWTGHKRANDPDNGCIMGKHVTKDVGLVQEREAKLAAVDAALARGMADIEAGRTKPASEVVDRLEAKYLAMDDKAEKLA